MGAGQRAGPFFDVDAGIVAGIVQRTVEGVALHLRDYPDADLTGYAEKLIGFFDGVVTRASTDPAS